MSKGFVYVLLNPALENLYKVGWTSRDPEGRARELSSATGIPKNFQVAFCAEFDDARSVERVVHDHLEKRGYRVSNRREFFEAPLNDIIQFIMSLKNLEKSGQVNPMEIAQDRNEVDHKNQAQEFANGKDALHHGGDSNIGMEAIPSGRHGNQADIIAILKRNREFRESIWYDEFYQGVFTTLIWKPLGSGRIREWNDIDTLNLMVWLQNGRMRIASKVIVAQAVTVFARETTKNAPKDWMETLEWDGNKRLGMFFPTYFGSRASDFVAEIARNFMLSMVARIYRPGCRLSSMVILDGGESKFKDAALKLIAGENWAESHTFIKKSAFVSTRHGISLFIIKEWEKFSNNEVNKMKSVISKSSDRVRGLAGKIDEDRKRTCIFVATSNRLKRVPAGGREWLNFWLISCGVINLKDLSRDREQLFAEAVAAFKAWENSGEDDDLGWWNVSPTASDGLEANRVKDKYEEIIAEFLKGKSETTITDLIKNINIRFESEGLKLAHRIGRCLRAIGWYPKNVGRDGRVISVFYPSDKD